MTPNEIFQWFWVFFIYAFLGWCVEVVYCAVSDRKITNRGFLNGPICPIYGFGVVIVALCLEPVKGDILYLFFGSVIFTSVLELITDFVLEKVFNDNLWDYSKEPLNFHGYICLRFSLIWGLACVMVIDVIFPLTIEYINRIPQPIGIIVLIHFLLLTVIDTTFTVIETFKLKKKFIILENSDKSIRKVSDNIGGALTSGTLNAVEMFQEGTDAVGQINAIVKSGLTPIQARLIDAYPRLIHGRHKDSILLLKYRSLMANEHSAPNRHSWSYKSPQSAFQDLSITLYRDTFESVVDVLEARDAYTAGHSRRVAILTKRFCKYLKVSPREEELYEL